LTAVSSAPISAAPSRIFFVDYLRAAIITLVILQHLAVAYGNTGFLFYYAEPTSDYLTLVVLIIFQYLNQAWIMGLFFLISGYFSPSSFDHKGPKRFTKDRLIRLGIPLLIFSLLLEPLALCVGFSHTPAALLAKDGITLPITWQNYLQFIGPGPLWFVAMLLIFDLAYVGYRVACANWGTTVEQTRSMPFPKYRTIGAFILLLALASWLVRTVVPVGIYVLFFPTLGYLPQYMSFFIIGMIASRSDWFKNVSSSVAKRVGIVALAATIVLFPSVRGEVIGAESFGGVTWQSASYALWDSTFAVGISLVLIVLFRHFFNRDGKLRDFLYKHSYTVYIIHILVIVFVAAILLGGIMMYPLLKFALAAVITVPLCWGVAYLVRKIPFANRIL
jgi:peptidoglycan/LPS O-acetylase OafA/YrhL